MREDLDETGNLNERRNWEEDLKKFEKFLESINLQKYARLREIKTVEQDLPQDLLPLELYYHHYWSSADFKDYDEIFEIYWNEKCLHPKMREFIKKYFYGCSLQFIEEGFKARLYRIWMSILTQFHFQYLWNALFAEKLESSAELDARGIDAVVELKGVKVGIQVKKISYRREASERRFTRRQRKEVDVIVEVPYIVDDPEELKERLKRSRKEKTRQKLQKTLDAFNNYFHVLNNGFVIFKKEYLNHVRTVTLKNVSEISERGKKISYKEVLDI